MFAIYESRFGRTDNVENFEPWTKPTDPVRSVRQLIGEKIPSPSDFTFGALHKLSKAGGSTKLVLYA